VSKVLPKFILTLQHTQHKTEKKYEKKLLLRVETYAISRFVVIFAKRRNLFYALGVF